MRENISGGSKGNTDDQVGIIQSTNLESDSFELDNTGAKGDVLKQSDIFIYLLRPVDAWTPPQPDIFVSVIPDKILRI